VRHGTVLLCKPDRCHGVPVRHSDFAQPRGPFAVRHNRLGLEQQSPDFSDLPSPLGSADGRNNRSELAGAFALLGLGLGLPLGYELIDGHKLPPYKLLIWLSNYQIAYHIIVAELWRTDEKLP